MTSSTRNALLGVAGVTFISKLLGFLREMVIAGKFGTSAIYDSYLIATMLPALCGGIFNYAGVYLLVPFFSRRIEDGGGEGSLKTSWSAVNSYFAMSLIATAVVYFGAPYLMKIWAGDFGSERYTQIVFYARVTSVWIFLSTSEAFFRAYLNARGVFTYPTAGFIVFNIFSISSVLLFAGSLSVGAVALGLVGGVFLQNVYLLIRSLGFNPFRGFSFSLSGSDTRILFSTAVILLAIEIIKGSYFLIDRYFAPGYGDGIISALNYSQVLVQLPDAVVGFAIGTVLFPRFSRATLGGDLREFGRLYGKAVVSALLIAVPLAGFVYVGAEEIVQLVFQRGQFDTRSVEITAGVLRPYAPAIVALFIISTSVRASYSAGWTKLVLGFVVAAFTVKFLGTYYIPHWIGYPGISAATSAAHLLLAILLVILLTVKTLGAGRSQFASLFARILIAGPIVAVIAMTAKTYWIIYRPGTNLETIFYLIALFSVVTVLFIAMLYLVGASSALDDLRAALLRKKARGN